MYNVCNAKVFLSFWPFALTTHVWFPQTQWALLDHHTHYTHALNNNLMPFSLMGKRGLTLCNPLLFCVFFFQDMVVLVIINRSILCFWNNQLLHSPTTEALCCIYFECVFHMPLDWNVTIQLHKFQMGGCPPIVSGVWWVSNSMSLVHSFLIKAKRKQKLFSL